MPKNRSGGTTTAASLLLHHGKKEERAPWESSGGSSTFTYYISNSAIEPQPPTKLFRADRQVEHEWDERLGPKISHVEVAQRVSRPLGSKHGSPRTK